MASLSDAVERPRVIINTNDFNKPKSLADAVEKPKIAGLISPGNIDLNNRPIVKNADGSISTVRSMSANFDGKEVLMPTVSEDGRIMSEKEAIAQYRKTGRNLGIFDNSDNASAYAEKLHNDQADQYLPKVDGIPEHHSDKLQSVLDKLFGLHGQERYQLWPEKVVRDAISAPHDVMTGQIPTHEVDPVTGEVHTSSGLIKAAQDVSALAGTGGLAGVGSETGVALGSGPLKQTMVNTKYPLAKPSERWTNTLGQNDKLIQNMTPDEFLNNSRPLKVDAESRENIDALKQHMQEGKPLDPLELHANGKEDGRHRAIAAKELGIKELPVINFRETKPFYSAVENALTAAKQPKADSQQWLSFLKNQPGVKQEELSHLGLDKLSGSITKDDLLKAVQEGQPQIKEVVKGRSLDDTLNDTAKDMYNKDYISLNEIQRKMVEDKASSNGALDKVDTKYHSYQLPGGENYREMLLTLPNELRGEKAAQFDKLINEGRGDLAARLTKELPDDYKSSHWDEPNVLAHIRMNDRMINGKKSLHLEEIQSDFLQEHRVEANKIKKAINNDFDTIADKMVKAGVIKKVCD